MSGKHDKAWNEFWANEKEAGGGSGAPATGYQGIESTQQQCWTGFAKRLPKSARVLDLATGDSRVLRWLLSARRDIKPVGCDIAESLPPPPRGAKVRSGVRMEDLPFPDGRFHAVISQFGFEYGDTPKAAAEAARVLRDGGLFAILTHRKDGRILAHNLGRREQLHWAISERKLPEIARNSLQLRSTGIVSIPEAISAAPAEGARLFGQQSAAWEIAEALRQTLALSARDHPANVARLIDTMVAKAGNELGRIASLEDACETTADAERFHSAIEGAGLVSVSEDTLAENAAGAKPFADFRIYRKA